MPTYAFNCESCGDFEQWQDIQAKDYPSCPTCLGTRVAKVFIAPAVAFQGNGFYSTDSRNEFKKRRN